VPRDATTVLSASMMVIGVAIVVRTISAGGAATSVGILLGVLFVLAGGGRLWVSRKGRS
jgi:hypothetical protein